MPDAMRMLESSVEFAPQNPEYAYAYGIALNSTNRPEEAIRTLEAVYKTNKYHEPVLQALVTILRDNNYLDRSIKYATELIQINPQNQAYLGLLQELQEKKAERNHDR